MSQTNQSRRYSSLSLGLGILLLSCLGPENARAVSDAGPPTITDQPQSVTVPEPSAASFYVAVLSQLPVSFQWRKNGQPLSGQTYQFLTLYGTSSQSMGSYDVVVSSSSGSVTSQVATLTVVLRPPQIISPPLDQIIAVGFPLFLSAFVTGSQPLSYRWFKNDSAIAGFDTNVYQVAVTQFSDAGEYRLIVTNAAGAVTGAVVYVLIVPLLPFSGPYNTHVNLGSPTTLSAYTQSSLPVYYQWYHDGAPLRQATNASLYFAAADFTNAGPYFVVGTNIYGAITSVVATLTIITQAPTASLPLANGSSSPVARIGDRIILGAVVEGGPVPTVQWQHNGSDLPGETSLELTLDYVTTNDTGDYTIVASNIYGIAISEPLHLEVMASPPLFVVIPAVSNQVAGDIVALRALALGGPPPTYQWRHNGSDLPGQTNATLFLATHTTNDGGLYEIVARNDFGEARHQHLLDLQPASGLDRWHWRLPQPQGSRLADVAFGNGRYVAAGKAGNIITSTNGTDWTSLTMEIDGDFETVTYGNGLFIVAGYFQTPITTLTNLSYFPGGFVVIELVSSNGLDWSFGQAPETGFVPDITYGNGIFVASGDNVSHTFNYTSVDGLQWTPHSFQKTTAHRLAWGNGRFVAGINSSLFYSSDGADWTLATNSMVGGSIQDVTYGNDKFVAVNYEGWSFTSTDGLSWIETPLLNYTAQAVAAGGGRYVATLGSPAGAVLVSSDAATWTTIDTGTAQELESIIYNGKFMAVGEAGTITTSADGTVWSPSLAANRTDYYGLAQGPELIVVAGDSGTILTSTDGSNWIHRTTPTTRNLHAVHYANGLFVAGGRRGTLLTSPDGVTWTTRNSGLTNYVERINWASNLWVSVAEHGDIATSSDGFTWTANTTGGPFSDHEGVAYGNGVWVVAGGFFRDPIKEENAVSTIYFSTNGTHWNVTTFNDGLRLRDVVFGHGLFLAVGNDGLVAFSTNGLSWGSYRTSFGNLRRAHYANGQFVIVGNDGVMRSSPFPAEPFSWIAHRSRTSQNLHDILAGTNGKFIAIGNNGMVLQSEDTRPQLTSIGIQGGRVLLTFDPGIARGPFRLETSSNLQFWQTVSENATNPIQVNKNPDTTPHFFRLIAP